MIGYWKLARMKNRLSLCFIAKGVVIKNPLWVIVYDPYDTDWIFIKFQNMNLNDICFIFYSFKVKNIVGNERKIIFNRAKQVGDKFVLNLSSESFFQHGKITTDENDLKRSELSQNLAWWNWRRYRCLWRLFECRFVFAFRKYSLSFGPIIFFNLYTD